MNNPKPKHTPGPCHFDGETVVRIEPVEPLFNVDPKFGPLFAAAPELLEVLQEAYDKFGDDHPIWHRVANAIAKAEGRES